MDLNCSFVFSLAGARASCANMVGGASGRGRSAEVLRKRSVASGIDDAAILVPRSAKLSPMPNHFFSITFVRYVAMTEAVPLRSPLFPSCQRLSDSPRAVRKYWASSDRMLIWNCSALWYPPVGIHGKSSGMRGLCSCDEAKGDDCFAMNSGRERAFAFSSLSVPRSARIA